MNDDEIERLLRELPAPELPAAWREEILAAAREAARPRRTEWPPLLLMCRAVFARNPVTAGALALAWILIFVLKAATPVDPAEREMLAHLDPRAPAPDFTLMAEQIRLAEEWSGCEPTVEAPERPRP